MRELSDLPADAKSVNLFFGPAVWVEFHREALGFTPSWESWAC